MRKHIAFASILLVALSLLAAPSWAQKDPKTLKFADMDFKPVKPDVVKIKKGIELYYKEDHETPVITVMLLVRGGSLLDPKDKEGLASITYRILTGGGTKTLKPEQVEEQLNFLGSSISGGASTEFGQISLTSLTKNFDKTWELLLDLLNNPAFSADRIDLEKKKDLEMIRRRWDNPMSVGMYLFNDLVYGRDFPENRRNSKKSVESIGDSDIRQYYQDHIQNKEILVGVMGDFKSAELIGRLKKSLADWKAVPAKIPALPKAKLAAKPGIYLIDKPDMNQAVVCLGHLGISRNDPDFVENNILNFIYGGGGFNSRIMREVRSNRGLAYSAFGSVGAGRDQGTFFNFSQTKSQSVVEAITVMSDIIRDMTEKPVTAEELDTAKRSEINSFVFRFDSPQSILSSTLIQKVYGYPADYLDRYLSKIKKVDAAKILDMAKRWMHPDQLVILVVGKKADILEQLKKLGPVTELTLPLD